MRQRDSQRRRVYRAEDEAMRVSVDASCWLTPEEAQAAVDWWWQHQTVKQMRHAARARLAADFKNVHRWPRARTKPPAVRTRAGQRKYVAETWRHEIWMPVLGCPRQVLLHELAHLLTPDPSVASHGREFCRTFLQLVDMALGAAQKRALVAAFVRHKVRHRAPRAPRVLTPEQREVLRGRARSMRERLAAKVLDPKGTSGA